MPLNGFLIGVMVLTSLENNYVLSLPDPPSREIRTTYTLTFRFRVWGSLRVRRLAVWRFRFRGLRCGVLGNIVFEAHLKGI